jgi:putative colanic acid biosynthesis acetyltransferase WcaF
MQGLWFLVGLPLLRASWIPFSGMRRELLCLFGAKISRGVIIKPGVRVKYPWRLQVGEHCWIGEDVWIDNLARVEIGANVCISQGAYLCTGNHDWSDPAFGLLIRPIVIREGGWVGAKATICPGVEMGPGAVAAAGSVVTERLEPYTVYAGNPAKVWKTRIIRTPEEIAPIT